MGWQSNRASDGGKGSQSKGGKASGKGMTDAKKLDMIGQKMAEQDKTMAQMNKLIETLTAVLPQAPKAQKPAAAPVKKVPAAAEPV